MLKFTWKFFACKTKLLFKDCPSILFLVYFWISSRSWSRSDSSCSIRDCWAIDSFWNFLIISFRSFSDFATNWSKFIRQFCKFSLSFSINDCLDCSAGIFLVETVTIVSASLSVSEEKSVWVFLVDVDLSDEVLDYGCLRFFYHNSAWIKPDSLV